MAAAASRQTRITATAAAAAAAPSSRGSSEATAADVAAAADPTVASRPSAPVLGTAQNDTVGDRTLDEAIVEIKEAIRATAARPGFNQMRSFLFNNNKDDEVLVVQDSSNAEEYQRLKNSVLKIKMMVYRTSLQFKLPYAEVLRRAAEMHKQERSAAATVSTATSSNGSQGAQAAVIVTAGATTVAVSSNLTRNLLTRTINSGVNGKRRVHESDGCGLSNQPPPKIQALLSSAAAATASPAASSALPTTVALPQTPVVLPTIVLPNAPDATVTRELAAAKSKIQQHQQSLPPYQMSNKTNQPITTTTSSPEEQRILRYGKAILKLKHFRRNLKYAIWDFQDGKTIEEACSRNKITEQGLRYTLNLIVKSTGESLEQFRVNKSNDCDTLPGPRTPEYVENLRQAVFAFKQKRFGSLFEYASQNQVSLFDLVDELTKELEIENKLCRLKPVAPSALQLRLPPPPPPPPHTTNASSTLPTPNVIVARNPSMEADQQLTALSAEASPPVPSSTAAPAAPSTAPMTNLSLTVSATTNNLSSSSTSYVLLSDSEEASSILSDIDEVIRDDTGGGSSACTGENSNNLSGLSVESGSVDGGVITLSICGVCQKYFTDADAFKEHEAAGCIDFEVV